MRKHGFTAILRKCVKCGQYKDTAGSQKVKDGYECETCTIAREMIEMQQEYNFDMHNHVGTRPRCRQCGYHRLNPMAHFQEEHGLKLKEAKNG